jgi:hypothetical protein
VFISTLLKPYGRGRQDDSIKFNEEIKKPRHYLRNKPVFIQLIFSASGGVANKRSVSEAR